MRRIFPNSFYNITTLIGSAIAGVSLGLILFLMLLETVAKSPKPYMGIIAFVILPGVMIAGLCIAGFGIWREHLRARHGKSVEHHLPRIDLNNPRHRTAFTFISLGLVLLLLLSAFGSYQAYEATDSDQFCGETCHTVMEPEYTAYKYSPHARVGCVKCHIGPGADWFVRSKLSGSYQVYATLFDKYPRPIPTPIENLRPAQETCEQCHWPNQFFSEKEVKNTYYLSDEANTKWTLTLLIKVGGGNTEAGPTSGIHWHMNINNKITYVPADSSRQVIPWVRSESPDGVVHIYRSTDSPLSDEDLRKLPVRRMDCIDCHNRPTHIFHPPARSVDDVISLGWVDPSLPNVKSFAVSTLEYPYSTKKAALDSIRLLFEENYLKKTPTVDSTEKRRVERAITEIQKIYSRNYFPDMKVSWKKFPDNIGHLYFPGCFRCHDGKHVSEDGTILSRSCNTCHTILAQKFDGDSTRVSLAGLEFRHPVDIGEIWKETDCSDCHNPG